MPSNEHPLTDAIAAQYERWPYPPPADEVAGFAPMCDLQKMSGDYWPDGSFREDIDILVAGCGTNLAAMFAHQFPQSRVVGIDVSAASLSHEERLKHRHGLSNLTLRQCPIEDVRTLGIDFDFISATGVIHHLQNPANGLRTLGNVLRKSGVISVMVYAKYGRYGISMIHEACRCLGLGQSPNDVMVVREALSRLSSAHPAQRALQTVDDDLGKDSSIVDMFLNARDRVYTVAECLSLVEEADLVFQGWDEQACYNPEIYFSGNTPLGSQLARLADVNLWGVMELLFGNLSKHWFHLCRRDRDPKTWRIQFDDNDCLDYVPLVRPDVICVASTVNPKGVRVARPPFPPIELNESQTRVFQLIDGKRRAAECFDGSWTLDASRILLRSLWRAGFLTYRLVTATQ